MRAMTATGQDDPAAKGRARMRATFGVWHGAAVVLLALLAGGCTVEGAPGGLAMPRAVTVLDGTVRVAPPSGYCVDPGSVEEAEDTAVLLAGRCRTSAPVAPAVMIVAVGRAGSAASLAAGGGALADYFTSAEGRAALSRSGRAEDVQVTRAMARGAAFLLYVEDRTAGAYWRSVLGIAGRLVTVSIGAPPGQSLGEAEGEALMAEMLASLARSNRSGTGP